MNSTRTFEDAWLPNATEKTLREEERQDDQREQLPAVAEDLQHSRS